jgi:hypothetical protein
MNILKTSRLLYLALCLSAAAALPVGLSGCDDNDFDDGVEDLGDAVEDAADDTEDAMEEAADDLEDAADDIRD